MPDEVEITIEDSTDNNDSSDDNGSDSAREAVETKIDNDQSFLLGQLSAQLSELNEKVDTALTLAANTSERLDAKEENDRVDDIMEIAAEQVKHAEKKVEEISERVEEVSADGIVTDSEIEYVDEVIDDTTDTDEGPKGEHWFTRRRGR